jgi:hypothetical protein
MNVIARCIAASALALVSTAFAGTQVVGFEIGVSTQAQVLNALKARTSVEDTGINKFSNGPMLKTDGTSYQIEGLNSVVYVFDAQKKLAAVLMDMDKGRFDMVYRYLVPKYQVASQQRPFVGDQFARFKTADGVIDVSAPHMSFEMSVNYLRADLLRQFEQQSKAEAADKSKSEASKF